jgi:hypothetical protein
MIEHQPHARDAFQIVVHNDPDFQFDFELLAQERQEFRIAPRDSRVANSNAKSGTQRRQ